MGAGHDRTDQVRGGSSRVAGLVAVLAGAIVLAGCSGSDTGASTSSSAAPPRAASGGAVGGNAGSGGTGNAPTSSAPPVAQALPVIATRTAQDAGTGLAVELNSVQTTGKLMTVTWSVRNLSDEGWSVDFFFWSGIYSHGVTNALMSETTGVADGVYVLDKANARRYLPARDKEGNCVCTGNTGMLEVGPGASAPLQAVFQAPPSEVTTVDVIIPHAGTFADAPVTRG